LQPARRERRVPALIDPALVKKIERNRKRKPEGKPLTSDPRPRFLEQVIVKGTSTERRTP
jgi:hypothetical protein